MDRCSTQLSYPVVDEPDSNRWQTAFAVALPLSYRPRETPSPTLRHTPRQGRAHRTACKPTRCSVFDRCSVLPAVANRQSVQAHCAPCFANPASRRSRRSITTRRTCAGCSRAPASGAQHRCARMLQGGKIFQQTGFAELLRCMRFLCERGKQNAPGTCDPRAFALAREIGVADLPGSPTVITRGGTACVRPSGDRPASCSRTHPRCGGLATVQIGSL